MKLLERIRRHKDGPDITALLCDCGSSSFRVELRWSYSQKKYEQFASTYGRPAEYPPDTLMAVCEGCKNEIIITCSSAQGPPINFWRSPEDTEVRQAADADAIYRHLAEQIRMQTGMPPVDVHRANCTCTSCRPTFFRYDEEPWH